ncbi:MAG: tripartite tricarboxylate transporter substrate binding protein [Alphaproteobacteria bacterium]|nr:tripartite tricarboxylate transporter substrate binding protein [Alphaproteobacteria bacterium]
MFSKPIVRRALLCGAILLPALFAQNAHAQSGTIRIIVGTVAGGAIEPYARMIAEHMTRTLGQPIIIENKPGASGNIAAQYIADQPADGTIVWLGTQAFTEILPNLFANKRWSIEQFHPIIRGVEAPLAFVAHPGVPARTFDEFLKWARDNKGKLSYSSYQAGTPSHFLGFQLNEKFGLDLTHVPYRGSGLQATALLAGHSQFGFGQVNSTLPHVRDGKLKAFATTGPKRDRSMPDVPTFAELGHPDFTAKVWFGLLVKEGTPAPVLKRLTDAAVAAHADPGIRQKLEAQGFDVSGETGPQLKKTIIEQGARWGRLVKASGISVEDRGSTR